MLMFPRTIGTSTKLYMLWGALIMEIIIIGGGVSGLTTGLSLLGVKNQIPALAFLDSPRHAHHVSIWAEKFSPETTSDVAAAIWDPYLVGPEDKVLTWGDIAYRSFKTLQSVKGCGVIARDVLKVSMLPPTEQVRPKWTERVDGYLRAPDNNLPAGYTGGFYFKSSVIDMSQYYLPFLKRAFMDGGGQLVQRTVNDVGAVLDQADIVINCSGLGARQLVHDPDIYPVRGQVVRIPASPHVTQVVLAADEVPNAGPGEVAYVIPRIDDIVLGGLALEHDEDAAVNPEQTQGIIQRCRELVPELGAIENSDVIGVASGLRPRRPEVRVERVTIAPGRYIMHNYGHGGAGVTLSWGCAQEIVQLVREIEQ